MYAGQDALRRIKKRAVQIKEDAAKTGAPAVLPRKNQFHRPAVANIDQLVIIASQAIPVTDPFLIDRVVAIAEGNGCESVICINKCDLVSGEDLAAIYQKAGFPTVLVSAETASTVSAVALFKDMGENVF